MTERLIKGLEAQIELKDFKLNSLLEITKAINSNLEVEQIMEIYEFVLKQQLGFFKLVLFNRLDDWNCLLKLGFKGKVKNIDVKRDLFRFKEITFIESSSSAVLKEFDIIIPVFHKGQALAYMLLKSLNPMDRLHEDSMNNISFIQTLTNIIVVAIENKRMAKEGIIQERIRKELEVAREMQKLFFPSDLPTNTRMDLSAKYIPRHEVGGDYYDFLPLGDDEFIICIGDVSGKGIGAAMLMANFQATVRTVFQYQRFDLDFLIHELNNKVMISAKGEKFITFFIAHYNANTRMMSYVNAGHNHPFLTNGKQFQMLDTGSIGLGMLDELPFVDIGKAYLPPNTTLMLYTDGVVELENEEEEYFGIDRLVKLVQSFYPLSMEDMNGLIFSKLDEWRGDLSLVDDTAVFGCRFF